MVSEGHVQEDLVSSAAMQCGQQAQTQRLQK